MCQACGNTSKTPDDMSRTGSADTSPFGDLLGEPVCAVNCLPGVVEVKGFALFALLTIVVWEVRSGQAGPLPPAAIEVSKNDYQRYDPGPGPVRRQRAGRDQAGADQAGGRCRHGRHRAIDRHIQLHNAAALGGPAIEVGGRSGAGGPAVAGQAERVGGDARGRVGAFYRDVQISVACVTTSPIN
jgi:hypothetical protein